MVDDKQKYIVKQPSTISGQLNKLRSRGCIIKDEKHAREVLSAVNYFRLAHYFEPFLENKNKYRDGTSFEKVLRIYDLDRELRKVFLVALEEIEITMRAICSNYHALKYGPLGYQNPSTFDRAHKHQPFMAKIDRMIDTNNDSGIVAHHKTKYGGSFPLWVIMELFSFGMLTYFYKDMFLVDKKAVVDEHFGGLPFTAKHLDSWLDCLSDLRNHCAHYNRLYRNPFQLVPKSTIEFQFDNTLFSYLLVMRYLHKRHDVWNSEIVGFLEAREQANSDILDFSEYGFPSDWAEKLRWH